MFETMSPNAAIIFRAFESLYDVSFTYQNNIDLKEYYKRDDEVQHN